MRLMDPEMTSMYSLFAQSCWICFWKSSLSPPERRLNVDVDDDVYDDGPCGGGK